MITLKVFFAPYDVNYSDGTAVLYENLITNDVKLILNNHLVIDEIKSLIDKAVSNLKKRFNEVNVDINWDIAREDKD